MPSPYGALPAAVVEARPRRAPGDGLEQWRCRSASGLGSAFVAALAGCHMHNVIWGYAIDPQFERKEAVRLVTRFVSIASCGRPVSIESSMFLKANHTVNIFEV
jgi:hypothetical protein